MRFKDLFKKFKVSTRQTGTCPGGFAYTVKAGDTIYNLAKTYGTTVEAIVALNPGINPDRLRIGQTLCIPGTKPPVCPDGIEYTIKAGDTYAALAARYNTTVAAITAANPGVNPNNLQIGQVICIPKTTPPPSKCPNGTEYTIKAGDTYAALAARYNTTVAAITAANPGVDPNNLQIGQVICIPVPAPVPCPGGTQYTIKAGDTLAKLAVEFKTTIDAIIAANPGIDPNALQVGRIICIPAPPQVPCPNGFLYTIKAGDNPSILAQRYGVTVDAILAANPGIEPTNLKIGDIICIPKAPSF